MLTGMAFVIIKETFHGRLSLKLVLRLLPDFIGNSRLGLINIDQIYWSSGSSKMWYMIRFAKAFNKYGATWVVPIDISKAFVGFRKQKKFVSFLCGPIDVKMEGSVLDEESSLTPTFQKKLFHLLQWKPYKNDESYFLFHIKSSFCS